MSHRIDNSKYSVEHRKEIVSILESLKKGRVAIKLSASHGEELITSVLEVNSKNNHVYLDVSADETVKSKIVGSKQVTFTSQGGIQMKWHSTHVSLVKLPDGAAFSILVPEVVQRIQRRKYFRLHVPQGKKGLVCRITLPEEILEVPIKDLSAGGIGIVLKGPLHPALSQGTILEECNIEFPVIGVVQFKLKVCGIRLSRKTRVEDKMCHIGMEFMGLSRETNNFVQRYMFQVECENLNRYEVYGLE